MYFLNENKLIYEYKANKEVISDIKELYTESINEVKGKLSTKVTKVSFPIVNGVVKIDIKSKDPLTFKDKAIISKKILKNCVKYPNLLNYMNIYNINIQNQTAMQQHQTNHSMAMQQHQMATAQMHRMAIHHHNMGMGMH